MLISICIFGYGPIGKDFVEKFRALPDYGLAFRIHMVQVPNLEDYPEASLNSRGQWKLKDHAFEDEEQGISFGDDLEWLRKNGWEGHDTILDCSEEGDYFAEEIEFQMTTPQKMQLFKISSLDEVDTVLENITNLIEERKNLYSNFDSDSD